MVQTGSSPGQSGPAGELYDELMDGHGAVLAGRRTVEQVDHWGGDHHGRPVFVPSHRPPGPSVARYPLVTYVLDGIESAMAQAKAAAGDRNVLVHGAYTAQRALEAGVLDELQISQVPVLFGGGRRLFDVLPVAHRTGDREGDRHAAGHPHPLPRSPLAEGSSRLCVGPSVTVSRSDRHSSGSAANAFLVFIYHPIPAMGFFHLPCIIFKALWCVSSPLATLSFRCLSSALITSSAELPWNAVSHGPPICLHVIVFINTSLYHSIRS